MIVFFTILLKLLPLYGIIALGFIAGRFLGVQKETVAKLLIYIIAPVVVFYGTVQTELTPQLLLLPVIFFAICCVTAFSFWRIGSLIWPTDSTKNLLGFTAGSANAGYFGLPVALALLGEPSLGIVVIALFGFLIYENSLGFYIIARGQYSAYDAFKKLLKLPVLYAFFAAILFNRFGVTLSSPLLAAMENFKGAYTVFGMMIIGMGLASAHRGSIDMPFLGLTILSKFIVWPALTLGLVLLDTRFLHLFSPLVHSVVMLLGVVPLAANTVTFASVFKAHPEKAAVAVVTSTLIALFYIPLIAAYFINAS